MQEIVGRRRVHSGDGVIVAGLSRARTGGEVELPGSDILLLAGRGEERDTVR